jgi:sugar lactone lactonase YvrE
MVGMHETVESHRVEAVGDVDAELGEGPCGDAPDGTVAWVDIPAGRLHRTVHASGETTTVNLGAPVSAVLPAAGGGALHRYGPDGRLERVVSLPVSHPTSCAFAGPGLADLYVTTASAPLSGAERAAQPLAGRLLRLRPGPAGIPLPAAVIE